MINKDNDSEGCNIGDTDNTVSDFDQDRRKLLSKFAAGAFAIPAVLVATTANAVPGSFLPPT